MSDNNQYTYVEYVGRSQGKEERKKEYVEKVTKMYCLIII